MQIDTTVIQYGAALVMTVCFLCGLVVRAGNGEE